MYSASLPLSSSSFPDHNTILNDSARDLLVLVGDACLIFIYPNSTPRLHTRNKFTLGGFVLALEHAGPFLEIGVGHTGKGKFWTVWRRRVMSMMSPPYHRRTTSCSRRLSDFLSIWGLRRLLVLGYSGFETVLDKWMHSSSITASTVDIPTRSTRGETSSNSRTRCGPFLRSDYFPRHACIWMLYFVLPGLVGVEHLGPQKVRRKEESGRGRKRVVSA